MALPSSGPLSLSQIQTEFGGTNPISLSEYYGAASGIPASGTISINNFYGASAGPAQSGLQNYFDMSVSAANGGSTVTSSSISDLSGNSSNATRGSITTYQNSTLPFYVSTKNIGGYIDFNIGNLTNNNGVCTVELWARITEDDNTVWHGFNQYDIYHRGSSTSPQEFGFNLWNNDIWGPSTSTSQALNWPDAWKHWVFIYNSSTSTTQSVLTATRQSNLLYVNAVSQTLAQDGSPSSANNSRCKFNNNGQTLGDYRLGDELQRSSGTVYSTDMDVAIVRTYNRALTASEISNHFNLEKARFGIS